LPKKELRSPRRNGRNLRVESREMKPHNRGSNMLSREGNKMISGESMLTQTLFLVPEVGEEAEEESSHVLHVEKTDTKMLIVQIGRWTEEKLTSQRRRGVMLRMKTPEVGSP
jgi:hypothetical protein